MIAQGTPKGARVGGSKRATGMEGWTRAWMGRRWGGPKAWTLRVGLKMQGLKLEAEDSFQANGGREGVRQRIQLESGRVSSSAWDNVESEAEDKG